MGRSQEDTDATPTSADGAADAAVPGVVLPALTTLVNPMDNRVLWLMNRADVIAAIIDAALIIVLLPTYSERSPGITLHTEGADQSSRLGALLVGSFTAAYVMIGFDSAGEMSEETRHPRRTAPRTILTASGAAGMPTACSCSAGCTGMPSAPAVAAGVLAAGHPATADVRDGHRPPAGASCTASS
ncbi:hypothetical protein [Streptomyces sp. uw30]|uniref:hypothetical protein n=1 Tax=Streptomyces sp. uw30 TaxID=1828179 RepID=UPI003966DDC7